jgi:ABC-type branched-subunit amino acid transport system substrate-binding protein
VTGRRPGSRRLRVAAALGALAIVASACGSRLAGSELQVAEGANAATGAAVGRAGSAATLGTAGGSTTGPGSSATGSGGLGALAAGGGGGATSGGAAGGGGTPASGGSAGGVLGATTSASCNASDNGGSTDVGVTSNQILIGNIASIGGVVPGIFQSAQQATEAVAAYINSQGGICGRMLKVQTFDDQSDPGLNEADAAQACKSDFALVGSASGYDNGGASTIGSCGIPDIAALVASQQAASVPNIVGSLPADFNEVPTGIYSYFHSQDPAAVAKAAILYLNPASTVAQAQTQMAAEESAGWHFVYQASVSPAEPNYAPYVAAMQNAGVQAIVNILDIDSADRLVQAMAQAGYHPQIMLLNIEEYSPLFIQGAAGAANGDDMYLETYPYSEASANPGMELFLSWMNRVAPGFHQDAWAESAWSAGLLFAKAAEMVGPDLTRAKLLAALHQITTWTGGGVTPPVDIATQTPSPCFAVFRVTANGYARVYPSGVGSFDCSGGLYHAS